MIFSVWTELEDFQRSMSIMVLGEHADGRRVVAEPFVFHERPEGDLAGPTIRMPREQATQLLQAMLDEAWRIGLRPTGFGDTTEQVKALKDHLADLREITFGLLALPPEKMRAPRPFAPELDR